MEFYAQQNAIPIIEKLKLQDFLEFLVMLKKNLKRILEIGTAIGHSALIMNKAYPKSKITTIEIDEKNFFESKRIYSFSRL